MNSFVSRVNHLGACVLYALAAVTLACVLTTAFKDRRAAAVDVRVTRVLVRDLRDYAETQETSDAAYVTFDLSADFRPVFDWNVKQLYVYVCAEYATPSNAVNQVVLWDKILLRGEDAQLRLKDVHAKYLFLDDGNGLRANEDVKLTLSWNVVPLVGAIPLVAGDGHISVPFPDTYNTYKVY